jgi:outer membrane immunogenic protein
MKHVLLLGLAASAAVACVGPVSAADLSTPFKAPPMMVAPASNWTGFYVGGNGGYGWANSDVTETPFQSFATPIFVVPGFTGSTRLQGALFGAQAGYNWQTGAWVLGIEGDFDGSGMSKTGFGVGQDPLLGSGGTATVGLSANSQVQWLATLRGRLGYSWGSRMLYATGGGAWQSLRTDVMLSTDTSAGVFSQSGVASNTSTRSGYAVGVGWEWMITNNWLARVEYLHYGFNGGDTFAVPVGCGFGGAGATCGGNVVNSVNNIDTVRAGLSYKF